MLPNNIQTQNIEAPREAKVKQFSAYFDGALSKFRFMKCLLEGLQPAIFSPFDLAVISRIMSFIIIWKRLSVDYSAIPLMHQGPIFHELQPAHLERFVNWLEPMIFSEAWHFQFIQVLTAVVMLVFAVTLRRSVLALGIALCFVLEWEAFKYRGDMFDADFSMALFGLLLLWPGAWSWNRSRNRTPDIQSTRIGIGMLVYLGGAYLLMGTSKFIIEDWVSNISLGELLACVHVWHQIMLPDALQVTAEFFERVFRAFPWFAVASAAFALTMELTWFTCLVRWRLRYLVPLGMLSVHLFIYLGSGIQFMGLALSAFAFVVPWRVFFGKNKQESLQSSEKEQLSWRAVFASPRMGLFLAVILLALAIPRVYGTIHPYNEFNFGWEYRGCYDSKKTVYRLGYRDPITGTPQILAANYFAFMDFKGINKQYAIEGYLKATDPEEKRVRLEVVKQNLRAIRPYGSRRKILGNFAFPRHFASQGPKWELAELGRIVLIEGVLDYGSARANVDWRIVGDFEAIVDGIHEPVLEFKNTEKPAAP